MENEKYKDKYLILPDDDGNRKDTKLAVEYSDEQVEEMQDQGYILVENEDFQKLIGNADKAYSIAKNGTLYETPPYVMPLNECKERKIDELKAARDSAEIEPVNNFDVDATSLMRINAAIVGLQAQGDGASINWTLADNTTQEVTAADLQAVICALAVQSNAVHEKYRVLKEQVEKAESNEAVEEIVW